MKLALIGASGFVGSAILKEALDRGHQVTAIVRSPEKISLSHPNLKAVKGDVFNTEALAALLKGQEAVISAYNPGWTNPAIYEDFLKGSGSIQAAVKKAGVKRYIVIGGAGSLYIAPGLQLIDSPKFPAEWKPGAQAARDYLNILNNEKELEWTFLSPAIEMSSLHPGVRTGSYRKGLDNPVFDANGRSAVSVEDLAIAVIDELENPAHIRQRFTIGY